MSDIFDRQYELIFGVPLKISADHFSTAKTAKEKLITIDEYIKDKSPNSYKLTTNNLSFDITNTSAAGSSRSWIEIENLSDELVNYIVANIHEKMAIQLRAGYKGDVKIVFVGTVRWFSDDFSDVTRRTRLEVEDGGVNLREAFSKRSYPKGMLVDDVISDLLDDLGVPKAPGGIVKLGDIKTKSPFYASGQTSVALADLAEDYDLNFSIVGGNAYVTPSDKSASHYIPSISPNTGLKGDITPVAQPNGRKTKKVKKKVPPRWQFKCFLNADILPMSLVNLDHPKYKGNYKVISVRHSGVYEGDTWETDVLVEEND